MKNITKSLVALLAIVIFSCTVDDVQDRPVIQGIETPELVAPQNDKLYTLVEDNADNVAERFVWSAATYNGDVEIEYKLMIDVKDGDFTNAIELGGTAGATQIEVSVKTLNQAVVELGGVAGVASPFDVKVISSLAGAEIMTSAKPLTILVNSYTGLIDYAFTDWYLIGAAVQGGWDNNIDTKHQPMFRGGVNPSIYKFTGYFTAGNFKLISEKGSWASQLGNAGNNTIEINDNAGEFVISASGYYIFTFNVETLAYTLVPYNASAASVYSRIGLLGSSRTGSEAGWSGDDSEMTVSVFSPHVWTVSISLFDGKGKFRANNAWDTSWGGDTEFSGFTGNGASGGDIPVAKSKYKIYFNDLDGSYLMLPNQE